MLPDLQTRFHRFVVAGDDTFRHDIVDDGRVDVDVRLAVYYDGYRLRLIEALETDFVALKAFLSEERFADRTEATACASLHSGPRLHPGVEARVAVQGWAGGDFDDMARAYIDAHTSDHFSLRHFGRHLADFLSRNEPWKDEPLLADIAAFEWAMTHAFDAEDTPLATVADMAAVSPDNWPGLIFTLHPSVQRIDIRGNAPALWNAADRKETLPVPEQSPHPIGWVIWRQELKLYFRSLSVDQAWMLDALRDGRSFADICEGLTEWIDAQHVALHAAGLLKQWLEDGMISEIKS